MVEMDRKAAELQLIKVCLVTAVVAVLAYFLLQVLPSVRAGITLTIFGIGMIVFAWTGRRVGIAVWKVFPVYRSEQPEMFRVLIWSDIFTGVALILIGWFIQIYIVNASPPANPFPPDHPEYEYYSR